MPCPRIVLSDSTGEQWGVTAFDSGPPLATTDLLSRGAPNQVVQLSDLAKQNIVAIGVGTDGRLNYSVVGPLNLPALQHAGDFPNFLQISSSRFQWVIVVLPKANGDLFLEVNQVGPAPPPDPVLGQLFNADEKDYYPTLFQPGGPGTPVFINKAGTLNQETIGEMNAVFSCGCGAMFNNPEIVFTTLACSQAALVCCPICRFISRIIQPASLVYQFPNDIIFP